MLVAELLADTREVGFILAIQGDGYEEHLAKHHQRKPLIFVGAFEEFGVDDSRAIELMVAIIVAKYGEDVFDGRARYKHGAVPIRSEERRVGKEGRARWATE